uniref:Uncharacterized protein n=1 Tax=Lotus japonicus TaxID=34305 RepID=I3T765_LOTJA|nr:unknown [Lotus japonicus]
MPQITIKLAEIEMRGLSLDVVFNWWMLDLDCWIYHCI